MKKYKYYTAMTTLEWQKFWQRNQSYIFVLFDENSGLMHLFKLVNVPTHPQ